MNALRLALGTLTVLPVPPPVRVDRRVAGTAMALAPLVAGLLCAPVVALALLGREAGLSSPALAVLVLAVLAVLTRGLHLDGLADVADGLGSGTDAERALAVMQRSDIGPFGVVTLLLVLLGQAALLAQAFTEGYGVALLVVAVVASRSVLPLACTRAFGAARDDGLGRTVTGAVSGGRLAVALTLGVAVGAGGAAVLGSATGVAGARLAILALVPLAAPVAGLLLAGHCSRRFGGITGDVLGAAVEATLTLALLLGVLAG